jgi:YD repeat-containing protein
MNLTRHLTNVLILLLIGFTFSCDKNDSIDPVICRLTKTISPGSVTTYTYNDAGSLSAIDYDIKISDGTSIKSTALLEYDIFNRIVKITGENAYTTYEYGEDGKVRLETTYVRKMSPDPFEVAFTTTFVYNAEGLIAKTVAELGYKRYEYDEQGNVIKEYEMCVPCDPANPNEKIKFDYLSYDDKNRPVENKFVLYIVSGLNGVFERSWRTAYNPVKLSEHNLLKYKSYKADGTAVTYDVATYTYNQFGYPVQSGSTQYEYDCR